MFTFLPNAQSDDSRPYQLSVDRSFGVICALGPRKIVIDQASRVRNATVWQDDQSRPFVALPIARENFIALEAFASPDWCSQEYIEDRAKAMAPSVDVVESFTAALRSNGGDPTRLLDYQLAACAQFWSNGRGLMNGSEQGTGKTRVTLACLAAASIRKAIVFAPKSVCIEWKREAYKPDGLFSGTPPFYVLNYSEGTVKWRANEIRDWLARPEPAIIAVNYDTIGPLWTIIKDFVTADVLCAVVADESHKIKSANSTAANVFYEIALRTKYCFCTTGTPFGNDVGDLFSQVNAIAPGYLGRSYSDFMSRYAVYSMRDIEVRGTTRKVPFVTGARDMGDLMGRLAPLWFRACKASVLNLPPKVYEEVLLDMPATTRYAYEEVEEQGEAAFDPLSLSGAMVRDVRLHQMCAGFVLNAGIGLEDPLSQPGGYRPLECPKIEWLKQFAKDRLKDNHGHRLLVWSKYTLSILRIADELGKVLGGSGRVTYIIGGSEWTDEAIDSFNSRKRDGVQVIVAQPKAIGMGKQITAADSVVYHSNSYSYIDRSQSEDRSHRIGREGGITYYDLLLRKSIDIEVLRSLKSKKDFATTSAVSTTH